MNKQGSPSILGKRKETETSAECYMKTVPEDLDEWELFQAAYRQLCAETKPDDIKEMHHYISQEIVDTVEMIIRAARKKAKVVDFQFVMSTPLLIEAMNLLNEPKTAAEGFDHLKALELAGDKLTDIIQYINAYKRVQRALKGDTTYDHAVIVKQFIEGLRAVPRLRELIMHERAKFDSFDKLFDFVFETVQEAHQQKRMHDLYFQPSPNKSHSATGYGKRADAPEVLGSQNQSYACYGCGRQGHKQKDCKAYCKRCKQHGHLAHLCKKNGNRDNHYPRGQQNHSCGVAHCCVEKKVNK